MTDIVKSDPTLRELDALTALAKYTAASGLWGVRSVEQAVALMALCRAEGMPAAKAVQLYHIIDGRPAMRADAMLARLLDAGGRVEWHRYDDQEVSATFSHPAGGSVRITWTKERAERAGYMQRSPTWRTHTRAMLRARCISEGVRTVCPGVVCGIYTPEEIRDDMSESTTDRAVQSLRAAVTRARGREQPPRDPTPTPDTHTETEIASTDSPAEPQDVAQAAADAEPSSPDDQPQTSTEIAEAEVIETPDVAQQPIRNMRVVRALDAAEHASTQEDAKAAIRKIVDALSLRTISRHEESLLEEALSRMRRLAGYE